MKQFETNLVFEPSEIKYKKLKAICSLSEIKAENTKMNNYLAYLVFEDKMRISTIYDSLYMQKILVDRASDDLPDIDSLETNLITITHLKKGIKFLPDTQTLKIAKQFSEEIKEYIHLNLGGMVCIIDTNSPKRKINLVHIFKLLFSGIMGERLNGYLADNYDEALGIVGKLIK